VRCLCPFLLSQLRPSPSITGLDPFRYSQNTTFPGGDISARQVFLDVVALWFARPSDRSHPPLWRAARTSTQACTRFVTASCVGHDYPVATDNDRDGTFTRWLLHVAGCTYRCPLMLVFNQIPLKLENKTVGGCIGAPHSDSLFYHLIWVLAPAYLPAEGRPIIMTEHRKKYCVKRRYNPPPAYLVKRASHSIKIRK